MPSSQSITITSHDNRSFSAYLARPETDSPVGAVVVIQEIFGVNEGMRAICDQLARTGYIAVCPDLFWRQKPGVALTDKTEAEWQQAFDLYKGFDVDLGVEDLKSTLAAARALEGCNGLAGTLGYCLGGRMAYLMACRSDADCNVSYYGVSIEEYLNEADDIAAPLMLHIAEKDKFVSPEAQAKIVAAFKNSDLVEVNVYPDVDHAFARPNGIHFNAGAADLANFRTANFLAACLSDEEDFEDEDAA